VRRIVTGHSLEGQSIFVSDGDPPRPHLGPDLLSRVPVIMIFLLFLYFLACGMTLICYIVGLARLRADQGNDSGGATMEPGSGLN
jgi:hypothetical protein